MTSLSDKLSQLVAERCSESMQQDQAGSPRGLAVKDQPSCPLDFDAVLDLPLDFASDLPDFLETDDNFDFSKVLDLKPEEIFQDSFGSSTAAKRKVCEIEGLDVPDSWKKKLKDTSSAISDIDTMLFNTADTLRDNTDINSQRPDEHCFCQDSGSSQCSAEGFPSHEQGCSENVWPASPGSDSSEQFFAGQSVEHHFKKIQEHVKLAVDALRRGQYQRNKSIVNWAHELKNKTFSEVSLLYP